MEADNALKVKTVDEMNFDQYTEAEAEELTPTTKKHCAFRKSKFSRQDSSVFDSEDDRPPVDKENNGGFHNHCCDAAGSSRKLR